MGFSFSLVGQQARTHLHATCQWQVADASSQTGGYLYFPRPLRTGKMHIESCCLHQKRHHPFGWCLFWFRHRARTHLNADIRWTSAVTSANTGHYLNFCPPGKNAYRVLLSPLYIYEEHPPSLRDAVCSSWTLPRANPMSPGHWITPVFYWCRPFQLLPQKNLEPIYMQMSGGHLL